MGKPRLQRSCWASPSGWVWGMAPSRAGKGPLGLHRAWSGSHRVLWADYAITGCLRDIVFTEMTLHSGNTTALAGDQGGFPHSWWKTPVDEHSGWGTLGGPGPLGQVHSSEVPRAALSPVSWAPDKRIQMPILAIQEVAHSD